MSKIAVDFGTGNTVLARFNETLGRAETLEIPKISTPFRYRLRPDKPDALVHVVPSLIHYSDGETLIGEQVSSRGLAEHPDTMRWMKRGIIQRVSKRQKTAQGHKSPAQAGTNFLKVLLTYVSDQISLADDEFTFTVPTEAFEDFQDWLQTLAESLGIRRLRVIEEPTACVLGYPGAARKDDRFLVFDFGCGTLDVLAVRVDFATQDDRKALQLGRAGLDLGGLDLDRWLAEDFCGRHGLKDQGGRELEAIILRQAEAAKIALSDPTQDEAEMQLLDRSDKRARLLRTVYRRSCGECERGRASAHADAAESCLGCILIAKNFLKQIRATIDRALENATAKSGMLRDDLVKVLVTGGTTLVPAVRHLLIDCFDSRAVLQNPFDAVAKGACRGDVETILQHDYALESYSREKKRPEFDTLFKIGTEYPTSPDDTLRRWGRGTYEGMTRIEMKIFEISRMKQRSLERELVDAEGRIRTDCQIDSEFVPICLNRENPTFIVADPPVNLQRDQKRFLCAFSVDGHRRLLVTVIDNLSGITLLKDLLVRL